MCSKNSRARWRIRLADSKASTKRSNVRTLRPANIRPACRSAGSFTEVITDENNSPIYLRTTGKTALAFRDKELRRPRSSITTRKVSVRRSANGNKHQRRPSAHKRSVARSRNCRGQKAKIEFVSGVVVSGKVEKILRRDGKLLLITFSNCTAKYGDRVLFDPEWGMLRHGGRRADQLRV